LRLLMDGGEHLEEIDREKKYDENEGSFATGRGDHGRF